jgi:mRNA export factor
MIYCFVLTQVRLYEVGANGQTQGKAMYGHQGPVLSVCWNKVRPIITFHRRCFPSNANREQLCTFHAQDGTKVLSGGADNAGRMFDISTGQSQQVAQHDAPIKVVKWIESPQGGILATGSWDKTIKVWASCHVIGLGEY